MIKKFTLCIIRDDSKVLLGMKKRGFGVGRWNGFGGKVDPGESVEEAAIRELREEVGITVASVEQLGKINFEFKNDPVTLEVNIFKADNFQGELIESEEMRPQWFPINEIPFDQMWPDDKYWIPLFLEDKKFLGKFVFEGQDKILDYKLEIINV